MCSSDLAGALTYNSATSNTPTITWDNSNNRIVVGVLAKGLKEIEFLQRTSVGHHPHLRDYE